METADPPSSCTHIVCALWPEAKPLVEAFGLRESGRFPLRCYEGKGMRLVVSGIGKAKSAAAVGFLAGHAGCARHGAWLNVGIAGHRDLALGELRLGHRISGEGSSAVFYPPMLVPGRVPSAEIRTVNRPEDDFPEEALYEMEAHAFVEAAQMFSSAEAVQVLKIVSDNAKSGRKGLSPSAVSSRMVDRLPEIREVRDALRETSEALSKQDKPPREFQAFLERWHFTFSETHRLRNLLRRWEVLLPGEDPLSLGNGEKQGKRLLQRLQERVDSRARRAGFL